MEPVGSLPWSQQPASYTKQDVGDSQNTTKYLFATAGVQDSNNYMFRPFLLAIIRLYIPNFKSVYKNGPKHIVVAILYSSSRK
jgi:hypothetical protein